MEKYLGNKSSLLPLIEAFISRRLPLTASISDLFAGTTNVSRFFAGRGYEVIVGDLNRFSYVLGRSYVGQKTAPSFDRLGAISADAHRYANLQAEFVRSFRKGGHVYLPRVSVEQAWDSMRPLATVLSYLQARGDSNRRPWIITEHFTQWGKHAEFRSLRGSSGKRNYFSRSNALVLDGILREVCKWWQSGQLQLTEVFTIMTAILEEIVITANVSGTFHDFNRTKLWPNALQPFFLRVPLIGLHPTPAEITNDDAVRAAGYVSSHDVCYIDPPYNFRQYGAYYHLLNFIAAVPFLVSLDDYLEGLTHVRGQNPEDDQTSVFCSKSNFIDSLRTMIERVPSKHVVLSYYNGRNHWNHWASVDAPTTEGLRKLTDLFSDKKLFDDFEVAPALSVRRNFQSRAGERKALVNEYLFLGHKRRHAPTSVVEYVPLAVNERWGISGSFNHVCPLPKEPVEAQRLYSVA